MQVAYLAITQGEVLKLAFGISRIRWVCLSSCFWMYSLLVSLLTLPLILFPSSMLALFSSTAGSFCVGQVTWLPIVLNTQPQIFSERREILPNISHYKTCHGRLSWALFSYCAHRQGEGLYKTGTGLPTPGYYCYLLVYSECQDYFSEFFIPPVLSL